MHEGADLCPGDKQAGAAALCGKVENDAVETALDGEKAQPHSASHQSLPVWASASTPIKTQLDTIHGAIVWVRPCEMILDSSQMNILKFNFKQLRI